MEEIPLWDEESLELDEENEGDDGWGQLENPSYVDEQARVASLRLSALSRRAGEVVWLTRLAANNNKEQQQVNAIDWLAQAVDQSPQALGDFLRAALHELLQVTALTSRCLGLVEDLGRKIGSRKVGNPANADHWTALVAEALSAVVRAQQAVEVLAAKVEGRAEGDLAFLLENTGLALCPAHQQLVKFSAEIDTATALVGEQLKRGRDLVMELCALQRRCEADGGADNGLDQVAAAAKGLIRDRYRSVEEVLLSAGSEFDFLACYWREVFGKLIVSLRGRRALDDTHTEADASVLLGEAQAKAGQLDNVVTALRDNAKHVHELRRQREAAKDLLPRTEGMSADCKSTLLQALVSLDRVARYRMDSVSFLPPLLGLLSQAEAATRSYVRMLQTASSSSPSWTRAAAALDQTRTTLECLAMGARLASRDYLELVSLACRVELDGKKASSSSSSLSSSSSKGLLRQQSMADVPMAECLEMILQSRVPVDQLQAMLDAKLASKDRRLSTLLDLEKQRQDAARAASTGTAISPLVQLKSRPPVAVASPSSPSPSRVFVQLRPKAENQASTSPSCSGPAFGRHLLRPSKPISASTCAKAAPQTTPSFARVSLRPTGVNQPRASPAGAETAAPIFGRHTLRATPAPQSTNHLSTPNPAPAYLSVTLRKTSQPL